MGYLKAFEVELIRYYVFKNVRCVQSLSRKIKAIHEFQPTFATKKEINIIHPKWDTAITIRNEHAAVTSVSSQTNTLTSLNIKI